MSFVNHLKSKNEKPIIESTSVKKSEKVISEKEKTADEILRGNGYKIKLITKTSFGTQFDMAKNYPNEEIEELLKGFNIKIKDNSVFVIN